MKATMLRIALSVLVSVTPVGQVHALEVESVKVFTTSSLRVVPSKTSPAQIIYLDEGELLVQQLGRSLPNDQPAAEKEVFKRMATREGEALVEKIGSAYDGVVQAWSRGITKLPAILIDDQYVVYGIYNVDDALEIYRSRQE